MSTKRHYWSKMNHDEARHSIELMDDAESGRWFRGWLVGAGGNVPSDEVILSKPIEWRTGYAAGRSSFADAQEYSQKQAERVSKRYTKATVVASGSHPVGESSTDPLPSLPITEQRTTNNEQPETRKKERASTTAFSAEAEEIYKAYPLKVAPDRAKAAIEKAIAKVGFDQLMTAVKLYAESRKGEDPKFTKQPSGWFNDGRYLDDPSTWIKSQSKTLKNGVQHNGFAETDYTAGLDSVPSY